MNRFVLRIRPIPAGLILFGSILFGGTFVGGCDRSEPSRNETAAEVDANDQPEESAANATEGTESESVDPAPVADRKLPGAGDPDDMPEDPAEPWEREGPLPEEVAAKAFQPPAGAMSLSKTGRLWIDRDRQRVYLDGYVAMKRGPLEMFACPVGTKEHESIVAGLAKSREVHAALLAIDAQAGTPVRFRPEFLPPTGQVIRVWVCWYDTDGKFQVDDGRKWIKRLQTQKAMEAEWVFAGSGFWQDPEDKREYYQADSGDMICVSNFASAMLDVAMESSADAGELQFAPFEEHIPDRETPIRLVLVPVPFPTDDPDAKTDPELLAPPTADDVRRAE